jgi:ATP-dependent Clp protease adapter protein ClpS
MKKLKHSKYKNTGILFEMLVRKLTSETMTSDKSVTIDIIKKYFGKNTELAKELQMYNALLKEQHKTEARAIDYINTVRNSHTKLNQSVLNRQKYNLVKEISERFVFEDLSKMHINNYKELASIYMLFEYQETDNPKRLMQCKNVIIENAIPKQAQPVKETEIDVFAKQEKDTRLLAYKLMVDKFNEKYSVLSESQKKLLNQYITNVNDTESLRQYVSKVIPTLKKSLAEHATRIDEQVTKIKVQRLSEMLCNVENMKRLKESHIVSLMRYMDLIEELNGVHR